MSIVTTDIAAGASALGAHRFLDEFALAYHRAVVERLLREPEAVINHARENLTRWMEACAGEIQPLKEWLRILEESDADRLIKIITDTSDDGQRLRSSSPYVGTLSPEKRLEILAACEQSAVA
jgi:hypothetical protein